MNRTEAENLLRTALNMLYERDGYLLEVRANERAITHRLANYIELQLVGRGWSVDCEYNRDGDVPKRLVGLAEEMADGLEAQQLVRDERGTTVFPDVIVHVRGPVGPNLLVVEAKRATESDEDIERDRKKLRAYVTEYHYRFAYLILLRKTDGTYELVAESGQVE